MMKKNFPGIIVLLVLAAWGCGQKTQYVEPVKSVTHDDIFSRSLVLEEYEKYLSKLDSFNIGTSTLAVQKFRDLFENANTDTRDAGYALFEAYYEKLTGHAGEKDTVDLEPFVYVEKSGARKLPEELQKYEEYLHNNGFQVEISEGTPFIAQDRDFIAVRFYSYVSPVVKKYLEQLNMENKEGFSEDAGIYITPKQFTERVVWWEKFVLNNPTFIMTDKAKENKKFYLSWFLRGMDNTPVLSGKEFNEYYQTAYSYLQETFPETEARRFVSPYYQALLQGNVLKADSLLEKYRSDGIIF